jgi:hypothetical protein
MALGAEYTWIRKGTLLRRVERLDMLLDLINYGPL